MFYSIDMRMGEILGNERAAAIFDRFLPGMRRRCMKGIAEEGKICGRMQSG